MVRESAIIKKLKVAWASLVMAYLTTNVADSIVIKSYAKYSFGYLVINFDQ